MEIPKNPNDPIKYLTKIKETQLLEKIPIFRELNKLLQQDNIRIQEKLL